MRYQITDSTKKHHDGRLGLRSCTRSAFHRIYKLNNSTYATPIVQVSGFPASIPVPLCGKAEMVIWVAYHDSVYVHSSVSFAIPLSAVSSLYVKSVYVRFDFCYFLLIFSRVLSIFVSFFREWIWRSQFRIDAERCKYQNSVFFPSKSRNIGASIIS